MREQSPSSWSTGEHRQPDERKDEAFAFQVQLEIRGDTEFLPRPDLRSLASGEWDERVADLQYRDTGEYSVGHNVATDAVLEGHKCCNVVRTCWIPQAEVERVEPAKMDVELSMDNLAALKDAADASAKLTPLVTAYREWIKAQAANVPGVTGEAQGDGRGIAQPCEGCGESHSGWYRPAGRSAVSRCIPHCEQVHGGRGSPTPGRDAAEAAGRVKPTWRPFQLAFILMNLKAIADPTDDDRETVDLLFFPTGGGKTEAYLGLAAFTLLLRRFRNPGIQSAGLSVLMRYTLRLLTLDQLGTRRDADLRA